MSKQVYVVTGTHDGVIGVFTNVKLAHERAIGYVGGEPVIFKDLVQGEAKYIKASYANIVKDVKSNGYASIYKSEWDNDGAAIEAMTLNY